MPDDDGIGVYNPPKNNTGGTGSTGSSGSGTGSSGSGSGSGGGGGGDPYLAAQKKAQNAAAQRLLRQAKVLDQQVQAIRKSLNGGFLKALNKRLEGISLVSGQQDKLLMEGYRERVGTLAGSAEDNEKAAAGQSYLNQTNRGRERANALSEATLQGAGESDLLAAQQMSLRSWNANQSEVNRGFFDTLRSVNTGLTDLNVDTKTARSNIAIEANADREQMWNDYFAQRSEAWTMLGNIYGQQAELYGLANEQVKSGKAAKGLKSSEAAMGNAFDSAANAISRAWENPGIPKRIRNWEGRDPFKGVQNSSKWANRPDEAAPMARPEGATLRSW